MDGIGLEMGESWESLLTEVASMKVTVMALMGWGSGGIGRAG